MREFISRQSSVPSLSIMLLFLIISKFNFVSRGVNSYFKVSVHHIQFEKHFRMCLDYKIPKVLPILGFLVVVQLPSHVFATPWTVTCQAPQSFPGKNSGMGCHFLLHVIFPTQGSNPHLFHQQADWISQAGRN